MKFGIIVSRSLIDRTSHDPYAKLYCFLNGMEDLGYDLGWCGHHRFSPKTAFGGEQATEPSAPLLMLAPTGGPDPDQQIRELRLFAKEVMPHFRTG